MPQMLVNDRSSTSAEWSGDRWRSGVKNSSTTTPYRVGGGGGGGRPQGGGGGAHVGSCCLIPFDRREGLTTAQAARVAGRTERRVRQWCIEHDLGRRVAGGPWLVSRVALDMFLNSDLLALRAYLSGDRHSTAVIAYYEAAGLQDLAKRWQHIAS